MLRDSAAAAIVQQSLFHGDGTRYRLLAWAIMPNHVHVLIRLVDGWTLGRVVRSWKTFAARAIGRGPLWHREYWDRYIRDRTHYQRAIHYIDHNPVTAGLCARPVDWLWSSAHHRDSVGTPAGPGRG